MLILENNRPNGQIQVDIHNEENNIRNKTENGNNNTQKIPTSPRLEKKEKKEEDDDEKSLEWVRF